MPVANSYNTLTDENKEARKTNTSDIGDYQSLVLRSVRITILLNHDNSFWTQLRLYEALDMVQEEQPKKLFFRKMQTARLWLQFLFRDAF